MTNITYSKLNAPKFVEWLAVSIAGRQFGTIGRLVAAPDKWIARHNDGTEIGTFDTRGEAVEAISAVAAQSAQYDAMISDPRRGE